MRQTDRRDAAQGDEKRGEYDDSGECLPPEVNVGSIPLWTVTFSSCRYQGW